MPRVFISHSSQDRAFVEQELVPLLEHHAITTWYSREAITTAALWEKQIREGLNACDWFLVVLSKRTAESEWVQAEVQWALERRRDRLVPVVIEDCEPAETHLQLIRYQHVDFRTDFASARTRLLSVWGRAFEGERTLAVELVSPELSEGEYPSASPRRRLLIVDGATIGRDPTSELCLSHPSVSRRHAELKVRLAEGRKSLWLVDVASSNGVFINGTRISAPVAVVAGDVIGIGTVQITVDSIDENVGV